MDQNFRIRTRYWGCINVKAVKTNTVKAKQLSMQVLALKVGERSWFSCQFCYPLKIPGLAVHPLNLLGAVIVTLDKDPAHHLTTAIRHGGLYLLEAVTPVNARMTDHSQSSQLTMLKRGPVPLFCWAAPAFAPFSDQIKMKTLNWRQMKIFKSKKSPRVKRTRSMKSLQWRVKRIESKQSL